MLRTLSGLAVVAFVALLVVAVDIVASEVDYREERAQLDAGEKARAERAEKADRENILKCAAGQTTFILYKGVWCNGK